MTGLMQQGMQMAGNGLMWTAEHWDGWCKTVNILYGFPISDINNSKFENSF